MSYRQWLRETGCTDSPLVRKFYARDMQPVPKPRIGSKLLFRIRKDWFFHRTQIKLKGFRKHFLWRYHDWLFRELTRVRKLAGFRGRVKIVDE